MQDAGPLQTTRDAQSHLGENSGKLPINRIGKSEALAELEDERWAVLQIGHPGTGGAVPASACH